MMSKAGQGRRMRSKKKLLVVSHDKAIRVLITEILRYHAGYEIVTAADEANGLERALREPPDLVILDMLRPQIDGYYLGKMLRSSVDRYIPLILLSHRGRAPNMSQFPAAAFLPTPFDPMALIARVESVLRKNRAVGRSNPFLQLSGHVDVGWALTKYDKFAIGYADLDNLNAFNQQYGSTAGDQIITHTQRIISQVLKTHGTPHDFVKHLSGGDFMFVTTPEQIEPVCQEIIETFDREMPAYYAPLRPAEADALAEMPATMSKWFAAISISIAIVTNLHRDFTDLAEIGEIAAELRNYLRTLPGSNYYINRRSSGYRKR